MNNLISNSKIFLKRNSSTILTCVGVIGVAATAVVSARDTIKAVKLIEEKEGQNTKHRKKEKIGVAVQAYIPTFVVGLSTVACVLGANILNKRTQASLASAYALVDRSYKEYRDRAKEIYGEESDKMIKKGIADHNYKLIDNIDNEDGTQTFFDFYGLQFFNSTIEDVQNAEKGVNELFAKRGYASLNDFYKLLNIDSLDTDNIVGWSKKAGQVYGYDQILFSHDIVNTEQGTTFFTIDMINGPTEDYLDL